MDTKLLAIVGMPGAGKTEVAHILQEKGISFVRFGKQTENGLKEKGLSVTPENEQQYREEIRKTHGMAIYAIKAEEEIKEKLTESQTVAIDGLYSWEEYLYIKEHFPQLVVIAVIAHPKLRYARLGKRLERPFSLEEARKRDIAEIENIHKGGPIAIADYFVENNGTREHLREKIDALLKHLQIAKKP